MSISPSSFVNLGYWNTLPMMMTNYGGDIQVCNVPDYGSSQVGLIYNNLALNQMAASCGNPIGWTVPSITISEDESSQQMSNQFEEFAINRASNMKANLEAQKSKLSSMLKTEGISDEEKTQINDMIAKIEELEKKVEEAKNSDLEGVEKYNKMCELGKEVQTLLTDAAKIKVSSKKSDSTKDTDDKKDTKDTSESEGATGSTDSTEASSETKQTDSEKTEETEETDSAEQATQNAELAQAFVKAVSDGTISLDDCADDPTARELAQKFRDAVNKSYFFGMIPGTDDKAFNEVCEAITPATVMSIMLAYNKYHSSEDGESFMEAFMYDADGTQKPKYGKQIADALKEVTIALGIYDECNDDFTKIYDELDDFSIDNSIYKQYDNIIKRITEKMGGSKYAESRK
jgi:hypothetical protein